MAEDILEEALRITSGDRNNAYGPPDQDFTRTAKIWSAILGQDVTAKHVALCMIALKLSRATWSEKRDHWVDIAGYARCGSLLGGRTRQASTVCSDGKIYPMGTVLAEGVEPISVILK